MPMCNEIEWQSDHAAENRGRPAIDPPASNGSRGDQRIEGPTYRADPRKSQELAGKGDKFRKVGIQARQQGLTVLGPRPDSILAPPSGIVANISAAAVRVV